MQQKKTTFPSKKDRELVLRVTIHDCEVQEFRAGGKGGQNANKTSMGQRVIHHPSGARAECRETRSQLENKKRAFVKMVKSDRFQTWMKVTALKLPTIDDVVEEQMKPSNYTVEVRDDKGKWTRVD